jgi:NAD(P)-dependent dehydrogenase (short-subunit alcohol dehydrogenase family)
MCKIKDLINLKGRTALITGANGLLGNVIAETLAELGADLILVDRHNSNLRNQSNLITTNYDINVEYQFCDLEIESQRSELISWININDKRLSLLINNAAFLGSEKIQGWSVPFHEQSLESWRRALEVNLTSVFDLCQKLTPILNSSKGASIINIGSIYGQFAPDWSLYKGTNMSNPAAYNASKGGLLQLTRWLATTLAPRIRVNAISPGGIYRDQPKKFVTRYEARTPLARMACENDFKGAVAYLSSDLSSYVTGHNLAVDGGWGIW